MALNNTALALMANELGDNVTHVALHTSSAEGDEISGGSPAYERQSITWNTATAGNLDSSNTPVFDVPADTTITHIGLWSALTGGTFYGTTALAASETFGSQGQYELQDLDVNLTV